MNGYRQITTIAAQELVLEGKAEWYSLNSRTVCDSGEEVPQSFLNVDGYVKKCLFKAYLEKGLVGKHHLVLPEVGIELLYFKDMTREEIELAKDVIITECAELDNTRPVLFSGCC